MNSSKPEVKTLGEATMVIEGQAKGTGPIDNVLKQTRGVPSYDLDE